MNLSITLNAEQTAALDDLVAEYNTGKLEAAQPTSQVYLETVIVGIINDKVKQKLNTTASQLVEAARKLPYENRLALISQAQAAVPKD